MADVQLVTGADGFVGRRLVHALRERGLVVYAHDVSDGDIAAADLDLPSVRHVFHLAAKTFVVESWADPRPFYLTNVMGTLSVLELCRRNQASLTMVSSYVYGKPQYLPVNEEHPVRAFNPYGHSKILAEELCGFYAAQFSVPVAVIRPFNLYGPGQGGQFLIPSLVAQALATDQTQIVVQDTRPRRDYLHVDDFVDLLVRVYETGRTGIYNAGSGQSVSIPDIVAIINTLVRAPKPLVGRGIARPSEVLDVVADISKAGRELGWRPTVTLADGLRGMVDWAHHTITRRHEDD
jgi:nucleoside-diphosphate-sugar epimerase